MTFRQTIAMAMLVISGGACAPSGSADEGEPAPSTLTSPTVFTSDLLAVTSVRQLSDGRVLVSDPLTNRVVVIDFERQSMTQVGRVGEGPQEYPLAVPVVAVRGDTSLQFNAMARRWLLYVGDSIVATSRPDDSTRLRLGVLSGADSLGRVLGGGRMLTSDRQQRTDSAYMLLHTWGTGSVDTIGTRRDDVRPAVPDGGFHDYSDTESAFLSHDGWVAVIRLDPYRVDWRDPRGGWTLGKPIPYLRKPVDDEERAFVRERKRNKRTGRLPTISWSTEMPPVGSGLRMPTYNGEIAVHRTESVRDSGETFDIVDRTGHRTKKIRLSLGQKLKGFGPGFVYVSDMSEDGVLSLLRFQWP